MINPNLIKTFIAVVNSGTMAAAARNLKITPAAVSKHICSIENDLGVQLLKRSTRKIELTEEGIEYFEHAKLIIEAYQQAEAALSHAKEEPSGMLKILCGMEFANLHLLPNLNRFLELYPKLRLQINFTQIIPDLEKEKVDIVLGMTELPLNCIQKRLMSARWIICASPEYLKKHGTPKKPTDLLEHKIITHASRKPPNKIVFKNDEILYYEPALYFNDTRAMRTCALDGVGIVQFHNYIIDEDLKQNRLVEILGDYMEKKKTIPIYVAYLQAQHVHIKIRKFVDFISEVVQPKS